ncbi:unnamed protein product [Pleuronectes platessa]|uniref:Uncharacterized protein n=1 Tax=Pleuronectes platessa TaxID=8262 RepID=A0A9N7TZ61_PLEPL|nr:unnamed protein product [Pleuronectes platessa]
MCHRAAERRGERREERGEETRGERREERGERRQEEGALDVPLSDLPAAWSDNRFFCPAVTCHRFRGDTGSAPHAKTDSQTPIDLSDPRRRKHKHATQAFLARPPNQQGPEHTRAAHRICSQDTLAREGEKIKGQYMHPSVQRHLSCCVMIVSRINRFESEQCRLEDSEAWTHVQRR